MRVVRTNYCIKLHRLCALHNSRGFIHMDCDVNDGYPQLPGCAAREPCFRPLALVLTTGPSAFPVPTSTDHHSAYVMSVGNDLFQ